MKKILLTFLFLVVIKLIFGQGYLGTATTQVNLRGGASTNDEILFKVPINSSLYVFDEPLENGFYHVHFIAQNTSGYIYFKYVKIGEYIPESEDSPFTSNYIAGGLNPTLEIKNDTKKVLTLMLDEEFFVFLSGETKTITVAAGEYKYFASAKGVLPNSGKETFKVSYSYKWTFYISTR